MAFPLQIKKKKKKLYIYIYIGLRVREMCGERIYGGALPMVFSYPLLNILTLAM